MQEPQMSIAFCRFTLLKIWTRYELSGHPRVLRSLCEVHKEYRGSCRIALHGSRSQGTAPLGDAQPRGLRGQRRGHAEHDPQREKSHAEPKVKLQLIERRIGQVVIDASFIREVALTGTGFTHYPTRPGATVWK
ncbi:hypothetical protein T492DRAFT_842858 [Pavlovales sp. CCMP2436]|nr:hypothetical protein T492DRAFT_842858 [Pavlovales sp. CCMP2436]